MDETSSSLPPEADTSPEHPAEPKKGFLARIPKKGAAVVAAFAVAGGTAGGVELSRSPNNEVKADVAYQTYSQSGVRKPVVEHFSNGVVKELRLVPKDNPYEIAQQLLWLLAHNQLTPKYWNGVLVMPAGTRLYHSPVGTNYMPGMPSNDGEAKPFEVPEGYVALMVRPMIVVSAGDKPDMAVASLETEPDAKNSLTDVSQVVWADYTKLNVQGMAYKESPPITGDGSIDKNGNPVFGNFPQTDIAKIILVPKDQIPKNLVKTNVLPSY